MPGPHTYTNFRRSATIDNWPSGPHRVTAVFKVERHPTRGERATRITSNPKKPGAWSKPKVTTYASAVVFADGEDGRIYALEITRWSGFISVMQSNLQYQEETIDEKDPRYAQLRLDILKVPCEVTP